MADAAEKVPVAAKASEYEFHGSAGGPFTIYGPVGERLDFITLAGRQMIPTAWTERFIKGTVPADLTGVIDVAFGDVTIKGKL